MLAALKVLSVALLLCAIEARADPTTLTFEGLLDNSPVRSQFSPSGVTFANAVALVSGISLNEFDFPPHSGVTVLGDDLTNPLTISFSTPMSTVSGWFTYSTGLDIRVFDFSGNALGDVRSTTSNNLGRSTLIQIPFANVGRLDFAQTELGTYVVDDLTFTGAGGMTSPVPEGPQWALLGLGLFAMLAGARRHNSMKP